jgi:hypothetical protein
LSQSLQNILATLISNGFNIHKVDRLPHGNQLINTYKYDRLGAQVKYTLLFTEDEMESTITNSLRTSSLAYNSTPIIVSDKFSSPIKTYTYKDFYSFFGGIVNTGLILISELPDILNMLGHNKLPLGLAGSPDSLHEIYVKECLQFILESPTRRYGIDRSFESLPDAVVLSNNGFMLLIDSKAYANGFDFQADDLKRFKSYVEDFRMRYSAFFGNILSFVVVSGNFNNSVESLAGRSDEFYQMCGCKLACLTSEELGNIVTILKEVPDKRKSINWRNIFSSLIIDKKFVKRELNRIDKDNLH